MNHLDWFLIYVAMNGTIVTLLAMFVSYRRITLKVSNGDGGLKPMKQAIRAHGNALEHVMLFGLIILALALFQFSPLQQGILVLTFTLGRVLHAMGMLGSMFNIRRVAAGLTYLTEVLGLVILIGHVVLKHWVMP